MSAARMRRPPTRATKFQNAAHVGWRVRAIVLSLAAMLAFAVPATAATYPTGFEEREIVAGLDRPMAAAWAPDGRMFVVEKEGALKVVNPGSSAAIPIADYAQKVNSHHDRGLLGVAVDGQYSATNPFLYLLYTYDLNQTIPDSEGPMVSQLMRVSVDADNVVSEPTVILGTHTSGVCPTPANNVDCMPSDGLSHSIGTVRSAPDGTVWLGSGDAASFSEVDRTALRTYDERSLAGKIIHVDRFGRGIGGHPFCPGDANLANVCTKLHAKGFRNPFRFSLRPGGGLVVGDVGWDQKEEVDLVPAAGGQSYGWPCYEGTIRTPGYSNLAECQAEYNRPAGTHLGPTIDYQHNGSRSVMGGPEYHGAEYPAGYRNSIFYADYSGRFVRRLVPQGGGYGDEPFAESWAGVALEEAPTGDLVVVDPGAFGDGQGAVRRIAYSPGNGTPVARVQATPTSGPAPLTVSFDARTSSDPDGDALSYRWDFGDGDSATGPAPSHTYASGDYTAEVTVDDGRGRTDTAEVRISSNNTAPAVTISGDAGYRDGQPIRLSAAGSDAEDGTLPAAAFDWDVKLYHADHIHPITNYRDRAAIELRAVTDHDADAHYEVIVTATDSRGATTSATARLRPQTTAFRLDSSPPGAPLSYGGHTLTAPRDLTSAIGFQTSVSAAESFTTSGRRYVFERWSDGGARVHDIAIPAGASGLVAHYRDTSPGAPTVPRPSPPPPGRDRKGPKLRLLSVDARSGRLRGTAVDASGLDRVAVALRRRPETRGCSWWLRRRKAMSAASRPCERPLWIRARLGRASEGVRWGVRLGRPLPAGRYRVLVKEWTGPATARRCRRADRRCCA